MPAPVVVSTALSHWRELVSGSGVPSEFFVDELSVEKVDADRGAAFYFGESVPDPDELAVEDLEELDQILFACSGGSFVWLFRFADDPSEAMENILDVSRAWAKLTEKRKRRRQDEIRPIAVLIGGETTTDREVAFRDFFGKFSEQLNSRQGDIAFRDVFLMSPRLEPSGSNIFHARHVWTLSVARLLLFLSARKRVSTSAPAVYAWKFTEIRKTDPHLLYEHLLPNCLDAMVRRFSRSTTSLDIPDVEAAGQRMIDFARGDFAFSGPWFLADIVAESEKLTDQAACERRLREAGEADFRSRTASALKGHALRKDRLRGFWGAIHKDPGAAWAAQTSLRAEAPEARAVGVDKQLESLPKLIDELLGAATDLKSGASELSLAQRWFVRFKLRISIALVASSLLGVLFFRAAQLKFENVATAGAIAFGCFLGASLVAVVFDALENRSGKDGLKALKSRHDTFEKRLKSLHVDLLSLRDGAARSLSSANVLTMRSKLLRLVNRLTAAGAAALQGSTRSPAVASVMMLEEKNANVIRFLAKSTARVGPVDYFEGETTYDLINLAVTKLIEDEVFLKRLQTTWEQIASGSDAFKSGAIDTVILQAKLSEILKMLPDEIDRVVSRRFGNHSILNEVRKKFDEQITPESVELLSVECSKVKDEGSWRYLMISDALGESGDDGELEHLLIPSSSAGFCSALIIDIRQIDSSDIVPIGPNSGRETP